MINNKIISDISVVIPCYMSEKFIEDTLISILKQSILPNEVIIVDDGSKDHTIEVVNNFSILHPELNISIFTNTHKGPGAARNTGIKNSTSKWIAFLDSDDLWERYKIESVTKFIKNNPQINFVCHNELNIKIDGTHVLNDYASYIKSNKKFINQLYNRNCFSTSAVVCLRDLILKYNGFDESLSSSQDFELWLRISPEINYGFVKESLGFYIDRPGNITSKNILKRYLNLLIIAIRHREKVNPIIFFKRIIYLLISLLYNIIYKSARKNIKLIKKSLIG
jgi:glycosyltransferase involved in cell wall biosynthesis